jgi:hypothetical protein
LSRANPYRVCQLCGHVHLEDEMTHMPFRDGEGKLIYILFCQNCARPRLTYIQGIPTWLHLNVAEIAGLSITLTMAMIMILIGGVFAMRGIGAGLFLALAGILGSAGAFAVVAGSKSAR